MIRPAIKETVKLTTPKQKQGQSIANSTNKQVEKN